MTGPYSAVTILIVEDSEDILAGIVSTLSRPGFTLLTAADGRIGLRLAREAHPDLVISDVNMPGMDGFELLAALRDDRSLASVLVMLLTAESSRDAMRVGMTLGADDYLTKPITPQELLDAVEGLLRKRGRLDEAVKNAIMAREAHLRRIFSHNLSGASFEGRLDDEPPAGMTLTNTRAPVLFCDLRQFVGLAEKLTAPEMTRFLNLYFQHMEEAALEHGASHIKLVGNGMVAVFCDNGDPLPPARHALLAALAMLRSAGILDRWLQQHFPDRGLAQLAVGVGLHSGHVALGGDRTSDNPVIAGPLPRIACVLEQQGRIEGWALVASTALLREAGNGVRAGWSRLVAVDGQAEPVEAAEVLGLDPEAMAGVHPPQAATQATLRINREALQRNVDMTVRAVKDALESRLSGLKDHAFTQGGEPVRLAGYKLLKRIGSGGMSEVYLAERDDGGMIALKVMNARGQTPEMMTRFVREYSLVSQIVHPNIVRIHNQGFSDAHAYIAMEYFERGDLRARITSGLNPHNAIAVARQVAGALEAIHGRGIVHRDLKPENVMIRIDDSVALADFGIAKALGHNVNPRELTMKDELLGSPSYMSPEQVAGKPVTPQSDLYSLGVMLFEMLSGRRPFAADNVLSLLSLHMRAEVPALPAKQAAFQPLVNRLMAKKPEDRYASATEVLAAMDQLKAPGA